jgi:hypothetical protein
VGPDEAAVGHDPDRGDLGRDQRAVAPDEIERYELACGRIVHERLPA